MKPGSTTIDNLPVELLQAILSELPIKDAVRTSVLSHRWENQWKEITKLELEEDVEATPAKRLQFIALVERLLVSCRKASSLRKFALTFSVENHSDWVNHWLEEFINPKIEELNLVLTHINHPVVFPEHLFTNANLTKLELSLPFFINLPAAIYLQSLKLMILEHVIFSDTDSAKRLFSGCPSLEELTLVDCDWTNVIEVHIGSPLLRRLKIREWSNDDPPELWVFYPENHNHNNDNDNNKHRCQLVITGYGCLEHFSYDGDLLNDYFFTNTDSVVTASLKISPRDDHSLVATYFVYLCFRALPNVKKLKVADSAVKVLRNALWPMEDMPVFKNLNEINLQSTKAYDLSCPVLLTILRNSPCLESLMSIMGFTLGDGEEMNIGPAPSCFRSHLKSIDLGGFDGKQGQLEAIKYLLREASVLEKMTIFSHMHNFDSDLTCEQLDELYDQILDYPVASPPCDINLI